MIDAASPVATIMIVSKDRRDELRQAIASAVAQDAPVEVLVLDDGSTDGTSEMVRSEFPAVTLVSHATSRGLVVRRNEGTARSQAPIVLSIDDDAILVTPRIVAQAVAAFADERIGAVAIPYANVKRSLDVHQSAPDGEGVFVTDTFVGTAYALRRDLFLRIGGYRERLFHQGEEADYCIRMLASGHVVRLGFGDVIHHFESPRRDFRRMDYYGPRNAIVFGWQNVPFPIVALRIPATIAGVLALTLDPHRLVTRFRGVCGGLASCATFERAPVSGEVYQLWRTLRKSRTALSLPQIAGALPASR